MALPTQFAAVTSATGAQIDANNAALGALTPIPGAIAGTNTLTFTPTTTNVPTVVAYANYMQFSGVVAVTNTGAVTCQVGSLAALNVYKDSPAGPVVLTGGELIAGCAVTLRYNSALNTGAGGFQVFTNTAFAGGTITSNLVLSGAVLSVLGGSIGASLASNALSGNSLSITNLLTSSSLASIGNGTVASLQVGALGSTLATMTRMLSGLATLTFTVTPANTVQDQNMVVTGAAIRDVVSIGLGTSVPSGAGFMGFCGTTSTITVRLLNPTAASIAQTTMTVRALSMGLTP